MCGRFVITSSPDALRRLFNYSELPNFPPRYNVAPTQPVPVVLQEQSARHFHLMRWGFLPAWVKDPRKFALVINARSETVRDKPAFRNALKRRRCLLPADGYYEWQETGGRKRPFFIHARDGAPIAFAGLAETWVGPNGEEVDTVAIVTTAAPPHLAMLHSRVPVTVSPHDFTLWLDCAGFDVDEAMALLVPPREDLFAWHEVSTEVNRVANDGPRLIQPVAQDHVTNEAAAADAAPPKKKARAARARPVDDGQGSLF
ncbi:MAG: SOS response-associated peptidase [Xanthobacteraceae bacterium]|nr:SOS response-associated peptidase [Xanthobacteraceae bacterium]